MSEYLCGSRIWVDYRTPKQPLKNRLYEYAGVKVIMNTAYFCFRPYKRMGGLFAVDHTQLTAIIGTFKPFCMNMSALGVYDKENDKL